MVRPFVASLILMLFGSPISFADQTLCTQTDVFPVKVVPANTTQETDHGKKNLDILWVIDDSSSMLEYQELLKRNIGQFFKAFDSSRKVQYQMQITTTSVRSVIDEKTWKPIQLFSDSPESDRIRFMKKLVVGITGNPKERGAKAVLRFLSSEKKFLRKNSQFMINVLTDEDDETSSRDVKALRSKLQSLVSKGMQISVNLISFRGSVKRYHENFLGYEVNFYTLSENHFSGLMQKMAARAMGNTVLDLNLSSVPVKLESVRHLGQSSDLPLRSYRYEGDDELSVDLGMINDGLESRIEVTYQHECPSFDRVEARQLIKKIAEIDFFANTDIFTDPITAHATIDSVAEFLKKNEQNRIKLIGAISYSANPLVWLKMKLKDREDFSKAQMLTQARANRIADELNVRGISPDRIDAQGSFPGFHRHWYSYFLDATMIDLFTNSCFACDIEADRRVIMKIR